MQTAKPAISFKYENYDIEMQTFAEQKLAITIIDSVANAEYHEKELVLQNIGCTTLIKAFEKSKKEIKLQFCPKVIAQTQLLEIKVIIESPFLKNLEETILLKKVRDVSETETVKKQIDHLSKRIKDLKTSQLKNKAATYYGATLEQKFYNGQNYEPLASIKLPKGRYLLTFTFLLKTQNQWIYLYLNQGVSLIPNSGFYMPSSGVFTPYTVRKVYTVHQESEVVSFTTYCANSYPVTIKNAIITAKTLNE